MAIAHEGNIGSARDSMGTTVAVTVPAGGVPNTSHLIVSCLSDDPDATFTVADDATGGSNTYTAVVSDNSQDPVLYVFKCDVTNALAQNDVITATCSDKGGIVIHVEEFSGLTSTEDGTNVGTGTSTTPSSGAISPTNAANLIHGTLNLLSDAATVTEDTDTDGGSGWTTASPFTTQQILHPAYKITTSAVSQTYNPTLSGVDTWACSIIALEEAGGGATGHVGWMGLTGVGI